MVSGIRSLCDTHEQVVLAWTGDIEVGNSPPGVATIHRDSVKVSNLTPEDKASLEAAIGDYVATEEVTIDGAPKKKMTYVPVFLDDKIAHGHYEGYCKTSKYALVVRKNPAECRLDYLSFPFQHFGRFSTTSSGKTLPLRSLRKSRTGTLTSRPMRRLLKSWRPYGNQATSFGSTTTISCPFPDCSRIPTSRRRKHLLVCSCIHRSPAARSSGVCQVSVI